MSQFRFVWIVQGEVFQFVQRLQCMANYITNFFNKFSKQNEDLDRS